MDLQLRDRVYVVTGATAGLGFASARALVDDGAKVVICSRTAQRVEAAVAALGSENARGVALDLAQAGNRANAAELIIQGLRRSQGVPRGQW